MCPIWPLHLVIMYLLALCPLWVVCQSIPTLTAKFSPQDITVIMQDVLLVNCTVEGEILPGDRFILTTDREHLATADWTELESNEITLPRDEWTNTLQVSGNFIGRTSLSVALQRGSATERFDIANGTQPVTVLRPVRVIDRVFTTSVALFVSLIFINFGCAMHWPTVKEVIKRPIGPFIGMAGQFIFMPLVSFGLGFLIFPNPEQAEMRLGMFFTGVSPGGGASNIWTFILGGNLNLSLAMTTISTLASFAIMPAWLFSLGQVVFRNAQIVVPYRNIGTLVVGLLIPLLIGLAMQKWTPKLAAFMVRILKGFSTLLLLFIIIFAIVTNLYIFELFTWQIVVAGMGLPWLGYSVGYLAARLLRQPHPDALAISIETGVQNTGISIFLLRYSLHQPEADLTTVIPVAVAIMTPFPMMAIFIYQKIKACYSRVCPDSEGAWSTGTNTKKSLKTSRPYPSHPSGQAVTPLMSKRAPSDESV